MPPLHLESAKQAVLQGLFVVYLASLTSLLVGYRTRPAAIVAFLLHTAIRTTGYASAYGVDAFAHIMLFYFIWMPIGETWSLDRRFGRTTGEPTSAARLALRVIQLHLCMVYFFSGLEKSAGIDWHTGEAIWCVVMRRDLCPFDLSWIAHVPWLALLAAKGTLFGRNGLSDLCLASQHTICVGGHYDQHARRNWSDHGTLVIRGADERVHVRRIRRPIRAGWRRCGGRSGYRAASIRQLQLALFRPLRKNVCLPLH